MRRLTQIIVMAGLTTAALTGNAAAQYPRSPDPLAGRSTAPTIDLRSPDARDSKASASVASDLADGTAMQDLRSPDARTGGGVATYTPSVTSAPQVVSVPANGFQWGDAGIGAAVSLGLIALGGGTLLVVGGRRRTRRLPRAFG